MAKLFHHTLVSDDWNCRSEEWDVFSDDLIDYSGVEHTQQYFHLRTQNS